MCDLDRAIELQRQSNFLIPTDHPERGDSLAQLSGYLAWNIGTASDFEAEVEHITEAIEHTRATAEITPRGDPKRAKFLYNLSERLQARQTRINTIEVLDKAILLAEEACGCACAGPENIIALSVLRHALSRRFTRLRKASDVN